MPDGIDISTAMKLIHSSNAKKVEAEKDPLAKEVLSSLKELKSLQIELNKATEAKDDAKIKAIQDSIESIKKDMSEKGVSDKFFEEGGSEELKKYLSDELIAEIKNDMGELTDDTVAALVKMMQTGKSVEDDKELDKGMEESLILAMTATLSKSGISNSKDIKDVINYLKSMKTDMFVTKDSISEVISMNKNLNNHLINITKDNEHNSYILADRLAGIDDKELQMLTGMEELPSHVVDAVKIEEKRRKLKDYPFGGKILQMEWSIDKINKKWDKWISSIKGPLSFIKPIFSTVGNIISLMWKTIIPTMASIAISLFTVVLPVALMILAVVILSLLAIYSIWKFAGNFIKKVLWGLVTTIWEIVKTVAGFIWDYLPVVWAAVKVVWNIVSGAFKLIDSLFNGDWAAIGQIVADIASSVWNMLMKFGEFIFKHPILGTIVGVLTYLGMKMTAMAVWQRAKDLWDSAFRVQTTIDGKINKAGWVRAAAFEAWQRIMSAKDWAWKAAKMAWDLGMWILNASQRVIALSIAMAPVLIALLPLTAIALAVAVIVGFVWYFRKEIWGFIKKTFSWVWNTFKKVWDIVSGWIIGVFKSAWEGVKSVIDWIWGSIQKIWGFVTDLPGKMLDGVKGIIGSIGDALNPFNWFAEGGIVTGPTKAVIGEAGPEAVIPLSGSSGNSFFKILNDFFDTFLPFFKPLVNFLWDNFKPYMPILQAVLDAIYSVVYSIISGLANLPGWLGGEIFADMLSGMASPKSGGGVGGKLEDTKLLLSIISGDVEDKPVLGLIGKNESEITTFDSSKRPMGMDTMMKINSFITGASDSMEVPKYAQNIQKGIDSIGEGIDSLAGKLEKMEKNIVGAVGQGWKTTQQDTQFELSKLMSRNSFNGGKV